MGLVEADDGWRISDELWAQMEPLLPPRKVHRNKGHNPRVPDRAAMNGILLVLRTGMHWAALSTTGICGYSSAYRRYREWMDAGVFRLFWERQLLLYDELVGIDWEFLSMDGAMTKAPLGGEKGGQESNGSGQNRNQAQPADRRKRPSRRGRRRRSQPE